MDFFSKILLKTNRYKTTYIFASLFMAACTICGCQNHNNSTFQGYVEGTYTYVSSAISGKLYDLFVDKGTYVQTGQLLFKLDPEPENSQLQIAKQNLTRAEQLLADTQKGGRETIIRAIEAQRAQVQAEVTLAKKNLGRYQELFKTHTIAKATLDDAIATYQTSSEKLKTVEANLAEAKMGARENIIAAQKATVASSTASLNQAEWSLTQKTVYSPKDALIFDKLHEKGEFIPAGESVVVLLPRDTLKVIFFIPQKNLSQIRMGEKIQFTCDQCHAMYDATVSFIASDPEYTPPVIFSKETRDKLVYRIEAKIAPQALYKINVGQPVDVKVNLANIFYKSP